MSDRDVALAFMRALWAGDLDAAEALLTQDARWVFQLGMPQAKLPGHGPVWPAAEGMRRLAADLFGRFDPDGFAVTVTRVIGEHDSIAIEYAARGRTATGADYANSYVTLLRVRDGLVAEVRPYNDTAHMLAMLGV